MTQAHGDTALLPAVHPLQLAQLRQADDVWNTLGVLNYLQALVGKSGIVEELTAPGEDRGQIHSGDHLGSYTCSCLSAHLQLIIILCPFSHITFWRR